jgi:MraZ protein
MDGLSKWTRMDIYFRGRFAIKLDQKGRLNLPSTLRSKDRADFVLTNGLFRGERCLDLFSRTQWEKLEKRIGRLSQLQPEVQSFQRFYLAGGMELECDAQGRLLLPSSLREYAQVDRDVMLVGMGTKLEIWSQDKWSRIYDGLIENFEATAQTLGQLTSGDDE